MAHHLATTNWTLILKAEAADSEVRRGALAGLCDAYWYPLYAFARRRGASHDDAADLTQAFFVHLIDKHALSGLDREHVRFRPYLLASFKHFEADAGDRRTALKRGGGFVRVTFDPSVLEPRYAAMVSDREDPERLFERQWALTLLTRARERLRASYVEGGRARDFEVLAPALLPGERVAIASLAAALGIGEGAVRVALHRFRRRFGTALREEVAATVGDPGHVEPELRYLLGVLTGVDMDAVARGEP